MSDAVRRGEIAAAREWMLRNGYMIVERERPFSCADAFYWSFAIVFAMFITGLATKAFEPEAPPIPGNLILALVGVSLVALVFPGHYLLKALVCRFRDRPNRFVRLVPSKRFHLLPQRVARGSDAARAQRCLGQLARS